VLLLAASLLGRLRPEILRHILVPSYMQDRSIPELSMVFRGDHTVWADPAGFAGFHQSPLNKGLWRSFVQIPRPIMTVGSLTKERLPSSN